MKNRKLRGAIAIAVVIVIGLFAVNSYAQFGGGDGSEAAPWQVSSVEHLQQLRNYIGAQHTNKHFIQTANIDVAGVADWEPVSNSTDNRFHGKYDGDDYEIRNLRRSTRISAFGVFGYCGDGCVLENIKLRDINITINSQSGTLVCQAVGIQLRNCSVTGSINRMNAIHGGIIGSCTGNSNIHRCWVDLTTIEGGASASGRTGGIVGQFNSTGSITECFGVINITWGGANPPCGGLVAQLQNGSVSNCYVVGTMSTTRPQGRIGGFIGDNSNRPVTNCYAVVSIETEGPGPIGGFIVQGAVGNTNSCYWNPELTGVDGSPGGGEPLTTAQMLNRDSFVRWDFEGDAPIWRIDENSIPYLAWEGDEAPEHCRPPTALPPSSLEGTAQVDVVRLTWERPSITRPLGYNVYRNNGQINQNLIEEEEYRDNTVECYNVYTYHVTAVYDDDVESAPSNTVKLVVHDLAGEGTSNNPYLVRNVAQLDAIRFFDNEHFRQTTDFDLGVPPWNEGEGWKPIGSAAPEEFKGSYDGNDFVISSLTINTTANYVGLFGYAENATLTNITLEDVNVVRGGQYTGALAGRVGGGTTISNCSSHGEVSGTSIGVGGLVGYLSGTINDSHSTAIVNAPNSQRVGGLVGDSWGNINRSWATGDVTGSIRVGGLCGNDYNGTHSQCYATGTIIGGTEVGGLYGLIQTAIYNDVYATGDVRGTDKVGGLVGHSASSGRLNRAYCIGRVLGNTNVGGLIGYIDPTNPGTTTASYWNTETTGQRESAGGDPRDQRHMRYPYTEDTYIGWNFDTIWRHDVDPSWNGGYPRFQYQEQPTDFLDTPTIIADIVQIDGTDHIRIRWEPVEGARSYKIFSSYDPMTTNWGDPIRVVDEDATVFTEAVGERIQRYYHIVASKRNPL